MRFEVFVAQARIDIARGVPVSIRWILKPLTALSCRGFAIGRVAGRGVNSLNRTEKDQSQGQNRDASQESS